MQRRNFLVGTLAATTTPVGLGAFSLSAEAAQSDYLARIVSTARKYRGSCINLNCKNFVRLVLDEVFGSGSTPSTMSNDYMWEENLGFPKWVGFRGNIATSRDGGIIQMKMYKYNIPHTAIINVNYGYRVSLIHSNFYYKSKPNCVTQDGFSYEEIQNMTRGYYTVYYPLV